VLVQQFLLEGCGKTDLECGGKRSATRFGLASLQEPKEFKAPPLSPHSKFRCLPILKGLSAACQGAEQEHCRWFGDRSGGTPVAQVEGNYHHLSNRDRPQHDDHILGLYLSLKLPNITYVVTI